MYDHYEFCFTPWIGRLDLKRRTASFAALSYPRYNDIREENLLQMVLWKTVHFALFLVKISINFIPGYSTVFFSSQCTSLLYNNFKILLQKFQNFCTMF
jgi:hypothetical protein